MTLLQKLTGIVSALADIVSLAPQAETALTTLDTFLDTV